MDRNFWSSRDSRTPRPLLRPKKQNERERDGFHLSCRLYDLSTGPKSDLALLRLKQRVKKYPIRVSIISKKLEFTTHGPILTMLELIVVYRPIQSSVQFIQISEFQFLSRNECKIAKSIHLGQNLIIQFDSLTLCEVLIDNLTKRETVIKLCIITFWIMFAVFQRLKITIFFEKLNTLVQL